MEELITLSDEKLVVLYTKGVNQAFDVLVERYKERVYTYIYHTVKCEELADDIFQETFVKAIITINQGRYTENGKFLPWIFRIAHNLIIDYYRQEKSENTQSCDAEEVDILNRKDLSECTIEDQMVTEQIHQDIKNLVNALPDSQKEVLLMRYYKNMSFKEIAETTNVSINTALGRMRYAILNMRRIAEENNIILTI
ncbi:MAG: sigma-70 family RNA polymerase sigma factor [Muribaculaceae bacterium]|nr:sigma-70 family RNA polymerase sigma factor [Muribaculaceae bacterium]MEE1297819.1 sigma-70 family RNA polymerase sigma factor [Muribaculaceae bacterium]